MAVVWMSHGDGVDKVPPGFSVSARTKNSVIASMADTKRRDLRRAVSPRGSAYPEG